MRQREARMTTAAAAPQSTRARSMQRIPPSRCTETPRSAPKYTIVVADKINLDETTTFSNDYSLLPTGSPRSANRNGGVTEDAHAKPPPTQRELSHRADAAHALGPLPLRGHLGPRVLLV